MCFSKLVFCSASGKIMYLQQLCILTSCGVVSGRAVVGAATDPSSDASSAAHHRFSQRRPPSTNQRWPPRRRQVTPAGHHLIFLIDVVQLPLVLAANPPRPRYISDLQSVHASSTRAGEKEAGAGGRKRRPKTPMRALYTRGRIRARSLLFSKLTKYQVHIPSCWW